jgi:23S rRNA pseudouridine2604 synthase
MQQHPVPSSEPIRLAKRLTELISCSRSQAEQYIEGGWVRVNGQVQESPQYRVTNEMIELDKDATLLASEPVTMLLHKPAGFDWGDGRKPAGELLIEAHRSATDASGARLLKRHFKKQVCVTPLEVGASGLIVFTQDFRIHRKLRENASLVENEIIVDVTGEVTDEILQALNRPFMRHGRLRLDAKVALSKRTESITGLRFAVKGDEPGRIAAACEHLGLHIVGMKRIRIGRVPRGNLPVGQWRFLQSHERF